MPESSVAQTSTARVQRGTPRSNSPRLPRTQREKTSPQAVDAQNCENEALHVPGRETGETWSTVRAHERYRSTTNVPVVEGSVFHHRAFTLCRPSDRDLSRPRAEVQVPAASRSPLTLRPLRGSRRSRRGPRARSTSTSGGLRSRHATRADATLSKVRRRRASPGKGHPTASPLDGPSRRRRRHRRHRRTSSVTSTLRWRTRFRPAIRRRGRSGLLDGRRWSKRDG
jgi:hypothetical protein